MSVPPSLRTGELDALWQRVRERLEAGGNERRGRLRIPELPTRARLALRSLLEQRGAATLDLAVLEAALVRLGVGEDLASALAALGHPPSPAPAARRTVQAEQRLAHGAARSAAAAWPEPWASEWIDRVIRAGILRGFGAEQARALLAQVRLLLDRLSWNPAACASRVELAAQLFGSAHALDPGTRLQAAATHALRLQLACEGRGDVEPSPAARSTRELWERAGVHLDLTSGPSLCWNLPLRPACGLAPLVSAASAIGLPLHLSRFALERHPAAVAPGTRLLVVENPRIAEAAAQLRVPTAVLCTHGQPSSSALLLLRQLADSGAVLRYHGDFDAPGLAICARMTQLGLVPWRMGAREYAAALCAADAQSTALPLDDLAPGPTPWDPALRELFARERRIVHQERLLPDLLREPLD